MACVQIKTWVEGSGHDWQVKVDAWVVIEGWSRTEEGALEMAAAAIARYRAETAFAADEKTALDLIS